MLCSEVDGWRGGWVDGRGKDVEGGRVEGWRMEVVVEGFSFPRGFEHPAGAKMQNSVM